MIEHGKRGPNGGMIDVDDPAEVFPPERIVLGREVRQALSLVEWAARERSAGRDGNAELMLDRASARLANAILVVVGK